MRHCTVSIDGHVMVGYNTSILHVSKCTINWWILSQQNCPDFIPLTAYNTTQFLIIMPESAKLSKEPISMP